MNSQTEINYFDDFRQNFRGDVEDKQQWYSFWSDI